MVGDRRKLSSALVRRVLLAIAAFAFAGCYGAFAQTGVAAHPPSAGAASETSAPAGKTSIEPKGSAARAEQTVKRVNAELGLDLNGTISAWHSQLDQLEADLRRPRLNWSQLDTFRAALQRVRSRESELSARLQSLLEATKAQLAVLGPAPVAGQPTSPQLALSRARLNDRLGFLSASEASVRSADLRVDTLLNKVEDIRRKDFTSYLLRPIPGIYAYKTWSKAPEYIPETADQLRDLVAGWWLGLHDRATVARNGLGILLLFVLLSFAAWRGVPRLRRWEEAGEPPFWRRASSAGGVVLLRAMPVALPVMLAYGMIAAEEALPYRLNWLSYLSAEAIVIVFTVGALVTTVFSPWAPRWRLIAVSDKTAVRMCGLVVVLAVVYSLATMLYAATLLLRAPFALTIAVALPSSLLLAGLVAAILRTPLEHEISAGPSRTVLRAARSLVWIIIAAIVLCALAGYLPLARFLAQQLIVTGLILALVYLLLLWVDGFAQSVSDDAAAAGRWLKARGGFERARREQLALPVRILLKAAVLVLAVPFVMLQWGYTWPDIEEWYRQLFFGFHIGNTQVTFGALLASMIVFAVGYAAARLFQGWLDVQVLQPAGISGGVRHSIRTGVGYAGILIAGLAAFSYAGFSLSSLAIVAGAFSIGIGFGLQNVVNNFVSGLIMLVERPVRVGDLVVVGGEEGYVRRISVRSTEIETYDRSHVLIPNSSFISEKLKNWTLRNNVGRISVPVGVAYDCDPRAVRDVLYRVARENPEVLGRPEPIVELASFGTSSIDFILYVFIEIEDINKTIRIRTDLSIAIFGAFAEASITIPFTQADIKIRNIDQVRDALASVVSQSRGPAIDGQANLLGSPGAVGAP